MAVKLPFIPSKVWDQPAISAAQVHWKFGQIINVQYTRFDGVVPEIELLKFYDGPVNLRGMARGDIECIRDDNEQDLKECKDGAFIERHMSRSHAMKAVSAVGMAAAAGIYSASEYDIYQKATHCIASRGKVMTTEECHNPYIEEIKSQSHQEAVVFGMGAVLLAGAAIAAFKAAAKRRDRATIEFTKAAFASGNIQTCDEFIPTAPLEVKGRIPVLGAPVAAPSPSVPT